MSAFGLRYPLAMLPVLLMQLCYKSIWLLAVALPLWKAGLWNASAAGLFKVMVTGAIIDLLIVPWPYVFASYMRKPGDTWRTAGQKSPRTLHTA